MKKGCFMLIGTSVVLMLLCTLVLQWQVSLEMESVTPVHSRNTCHQSLPGEWEYSEHNLECILPVIAYTPCTYKTGHGEEGAFTNGTTSWYSYGLAPVLDFHSSIPHPRRILINRLHRLLI